MLKPLIFASSLTFCSSAILAEPVDPCGGLSGSALEQCRSGQQTRQQEALDKLQERLQQQQQRQQQLDEEQRQMQVQMEQMRQQNETLRKQLDSQASAIQSAQPRESDRRKAAKLNSAELNTWKSANPWYGSDYTKTAFAMRYTKQLEQEQPDLTGRPLLDAVSAKVSEQFDTRK
jgi:TolA-binding protein